MKKIFLVAMIGMLFSCNTAAQKDSKKETFKVTKTESEWKEQLSAKAFYVLRQAGTERSFTSPLNGNKIAGTYHCAGCNTALFTSETKFDSGTGWPSFYKEIEGSVAYSTDYKIGRARTEEHCATCGGHLGHVFNDGPKPTGKRHCINGVSLKFVPKK